MDKKRLMDLIYDKLADNDEMEQFDCHNTEDMCVVNDVDSGETLIAMVIDGVEYVLSIAEHKKTDIWQVFDPSYSDIERSE